IGIISVIVLGVVLYFGHQFYGYQRAVSVLPGEGEEVLFTELGMGERYMMENNGLVRIDAEATAEGVMVYESVPSPRVDGEQIILGSTPGMLGMFMGILHADKTVTMLSTGGTNKSNLQVREDGVVIFA